MRISDWSSDVCSSDLGEGDRPDLRAGGAGADRRAGRAAGGVAVADMDHRIPELRLDGAALSRHRRAAGRGPRETGFAADQRDVLRRLPHPPADRGHHGMTRSEEHTSELQSLIRTSHAVYRFKKSK